jgi:hypothetical protein
VVAIALLSQAAESKRLLRAALKLLLIAATALLHLGLVIIWAP